ncbi:uncharacterized protein LOC141620269 [Silene latifolia]|uniref:uncharacterized protein LOC141620269 n=1 Tax=Silene latifolia TaxID=37657 RepID=UPI003D789B53
MQTLVLSPKRPVGPIFHKLVQELIAQVFLKVSPMKDIKRFGIKGKLSTKYFEPYEVLKRVGEVAYRLALPPNLSKVHDVFHLSQLRHYCSDPSHVLQANDIEVEPNLIYEERPVRILERQEERLRNKIVAFFLGM